MLAETGRVAEARKAIDEAAQANVKATDRGSRTTQELHLAYARLGLAHTAADRAALAKQMTALADEAAQLPWLAVALEARLVRARALGSATELAAVEAEARALGQVTLADDAHEATSELAAL